MPTPRPSTYWTRALTCALATALLPVASLGRTATPSPAPFVAPPVMRALCRPPNRAFSLRLPGQPLSLAQTADGCYLFVGFAPAAADAHRGIALLHREGRSYAFVRSFDTGGTTAALAISRDGSLLAASVLDHGIVMLDVARALGGDPRAVTADLVDPSVRATSALAFDATGNRLYATDKADSAVLAIDVAAARIGSGLRPALFSHRIPLDLGPVALALAPDGARLYVAIDTRSAAKNLAAPCRTAYTPGAGIYQPDGVLAVLDLAHADRDGIAPTLARIDAGCTPNGLAISGDGATVWIADHGDHDIVAYEAAAMTGDGARAVIARTSLSFDPDALGTVGGGDLLLAAGYEKAQDLQHDLAIVTRATSLGRSTLKARLPIGRFPRSILPFVDGSGAMVASYSASTLSFFPASYLRFELEPPAASTHGKKRTTPQHRHRVP